MKTVTLTFCILSLILLVVSCSNQNVKAQKAVEEHLKNFNAKEVKVDLLHTSQEFPDKAYVSTTVTYNFASADGKLQEEYLGFILKKDGENWQVEQNVPYSKNEDQAKIYLAGRKK